LQALILGPDVQPRGEHLLLLELLVLLVDDVLLPLEVAPPQLEALTQLRHHLVHVLLDAVQDVLLLLLQFREVVDHDRRDVEGL